MRRLVHETQLYPEASLRAIKKALGQDVRPEDEENLDVLRVCAEIEREARGPPVRDPTLVQRYAASLRQAIASLTLVEVIQCPPGTLGSPRAPP